MSQHIGAIELEDLIYLLEYSSAHRFGDLCIEYLFNIGETELEYM